MIKLLSKFFIKENSSKEQLRAAYGTLCSFMGIALNVFLFAIKFFAGILSGAISVTADAFNNLSDSGSSLITLMGFRLSRKKPDPAHPFGHGRIEYLSGIAVSVLIVIMGFELLTSSVEKIFNPEAVEVSVLVIAILIASVAVKGYMYLYNRKYGKLYSSSAMLATATDCLSDALSTTVVLVSMLITRFTNVNIDAYCGCAVALFILYAGAKSAYETVQPLLGQPPEKETVDGISEIVLGYDIVLGIHDLVVHDYGPGRMMISLHAEVDSKGDILEIHDEIDNIEKALSEQLNCSAVIHMDPIVTDDEEMKEYKELAKKACSEISSEIGIHDFRMVKGNTHTNLIFDVVVPFGFRLNDEELKKEVNGKINESNNKLFTVITVDKDYTDSK